MFRRNGETTAINSRGKRILQTTFPDGSELVEEYSLHTGDILIRKRKRSNVLSKTSEWEYLHGDEDEQHNASSGLAPSHQNPKFCRKDTEGEFRWRIRNLPYPSDIFKVHTDTKTRDVIISTVNKKYYKRFKIPELDILGIEYEGRRLSFSHANNTLIVSYSKPSQVLEQEKRDLEELRAGVKADGDVECKQQ
ncbi:hypothetical protein BSKO_12831 [Bryopsis sp. KO-2023]|nr:hypothetical protein BSKO_12831 [Bryopsis sp. KO-2023]